MTDETMNQLFLIARIAGQRVAIPSATIDSVVEIDAITPVPRAPCHVAGLAALRSRVLTVIDSEAALGRPAAPPAAGAVSQAVVVCCEGHLYGLLVDAVDDVVDLAAGIQPLRSGLGAGWGQVASGLIEHDGEALLLVDAAALVAGPVPIAA